MLRKTGADDGETLELGWRAREYVAILQARSAPEAAAEAVEQFAVRPSPLLGELPPPQIVADACRETFVMLVSLGAYEAADRLVAAVEAAFPDNDAAAACTAVALGFLYLNHHQAPGKAAQWFGRAVEASERLAAHAAQSAALLWPARLHQAIALADAGERQRAGEVVRPLLRSAPAGLPAIPPDLRARAETLVRTKRLLA